MLIHMSSVDEDNKGQTKFVDYYGNGEQSYGVNMISFFDEGEETMNVDRVEPELDAYPKTLQGLTINEEGDEMVKEMAMRKMRKVTMMMGTMARRNMPWTLW